MELGNVLQLSGTHVAIVTDGNINTTELCQFNEAYVF